ncbi:BON domain-containing protein [Burkholderia sp. R-69980]|jgi:Predicted periplasmic or secreted lipoprotein|nr:BON domain-containing protein [Burkholderia sp. R-69980]MCI0152020.1 BON domain-containing protein [Paraburkholderia sediminicola]
MKAIEALRLAAAGVLVIAASINAWSQPGEAGIAPTGSTPVASGVTTSKSTRQANRALSKKVRATLIQDRQIDAANISVRAKDGAVTLYGTVSDAAQIARAADVAQGVPGVTSVRNVLTVKREFGQ